jgi:hypothetical protein
MRLHGDKQTERSVLEKLQPYMGQSVEQALEELDLTEEYVALRFLGFELRRMRRVTHSRRRRWSRWLSLLGVLATLAAGVIKVWFMN